MEHSHDGLDGLECFACASGGLANAVKGIADQVEKYSMAIVAVPDGEPHPFAYTVGLAKRGLAEVIVFGMPHDLAQHWLNKLFMTAETLTEGPIEVEAQYRQVWELVEVTDVDGQYVNMARNLYGDDIRIMQLCWPDRNGLLPWDEGNQGYYEVLPRKE